MDKTLGTCSLCGGRVTVPDAWWCLDPPVPTCQQCRARQKPSHGPVIEMDPASRPLPDGVPSYKELVQRAWERQRGR